jgi:hypothetical protein
MPPLSGRLHLDGRSVNYQDVALNPYGCGY